MHLFYVACVYNFVSIGLLITSYTACIGLCNLCETKGELSRVEGFWMHREWLNLQSCYGSCFSSFLVKEGSEEARGLNGIVYKGLGNYFPSPTSLTLVDDERPNMSIGNNKNCKSFV